MTLTPQPPFPKTVADKLRSADWNDINDELVRLERDRVDRATARVDGPLTVKDLTVTTAAVNVPDGSLPGSSLRAGSLPATVLADNALGSATVRDLQGEKMPLNGVPGSKLALQSLPGTKFTDSSIPGTKIQPAGSPSGWISPGTLGANKLKVTRRDVTVKVPSTVNSFTIELERYGPGVAGPFLSFYRITRLQADDGDKAMTVTAPDLAQWEYIPRGDATLPNGGFRKFVFVTSQTPLNFTADYSVFSIERA
jgi:hypothetical protein